MSVHANHDEARWQRHPSLPPAFWLLTLAMAVDDLADELRAAHDAMPDKLAVELASENLEQVRERLDAIADELRKSSYRANACN